MIMDRFRTSILLTAICLWLCLLLGCGGAEEPSAPVQQVVKGKIPAVEPQAPAPKPAPPPAPAPTSAPKPGPTPTDAKAVKSTPAPSEAPQTISPEPKQAAAVAPTPVPVKSPPSAETVAAPPAPSPPKSPADTTVSATDTAASAPLPQTQASGEQIAAPAKTSEPAPDLANLLTLGKPYTYEPEGKIDPFISVFEAQEPTEIDTEKGQTPKRIPQSPLEMVDLSQLKLTGVILDPSGNRALVQDATGKGYVVYMGTYLGNREGQVTKILQDRLIVTEKTQDQLGRQVNAEREIKLPKPPGEM